MCPHSFSKGANGSRRAHISRNRQRPERAAVITLLPRNHAKTSRLAALDPILPREFYRRLGSFGSAGSEIYAPVSAHALRRQSQNPRGQFFSDGGVKLRRMHVGEPRGLLGDGLRDLRHAVTDRHHRRAARRIQITPTAHRMTQNIPHPAAPRDKPSKNFVGKWLRRSLAAG